MGNHHFAVQSASMAKKTIAWVHRILQERGIVIASPLLASSPSGTAVPEELAKKFKFATQKSKLAGAIRGSFFVIRGEY